VTDLKTLDPRIKRTRALLEDALVKLLETKTFDDISVQDLAEAATLNRGTFYAHYPDKFALLECVTAGRFIELLAARDVIFDGTCASGLKKTFLGICDYLAKATKDCRGVGHPLDPHMELAIVKVVTKMTLEGLQLQPDWQGALSPEMVAAMISSALYGAARQWFIAPERGDAEATAEQMAGLLLPLMHQAAGHR
jgi:AcrR family transcriptional regulator